MTDCQRCRILDTIKDLTISIQYKSTQSYMLSRKIEYLSEIIRASLDPSEDEYKLINIFINWLDADDKEYYIRLLKG